MSSPSPAPFEDQAKTEMRGRCEIAIDHAGYELVEHALGIDVPADMGLQGRLKGDLQSLDGEGARYCYYLRPNPSDALSKWLVNLARAAHRIPNVKFYVVVDDLTPSFERSCRAAGAGLLGISQDNEFEQHLDFDSILPEALASEFEKETASLRRAMEDKLDLNQTELRSRLEEIGKLTLHMSEATATKYRQGVETQFRLWSEWSEEISVRLDGAVGNPKAADLEAMRLSIEAGPDLDADEDFKGDD